MTTGFASPSSKLLTLPMTWATGRGMFFYLSKILWFFAAPSSLMVMLLAFAFVLLSTRFARAGRRLVLMLIVLFALFGPLPGGLLLLRPLEDRFPMPRSDLPSPTGIIVLGGGVDEVVSAVRGTQELSDSGTRMTASAMLAQRYPLARLVFTGGSGRLLGGDLSEADIARQIYTGLGIASSRMTFENESRNTWENAVFTRNLVKPQAGETWLLVTSAYHMPRSVGIFRTAGFDIVPWPVDYTTRGDWRDAIRSPMEASMGLRYTDRAVREYIGLVAYYLSGRTGVLFPAP